MTDLEREWQERERRRIAWHEAGHAAIRLAVSGPGSVELVSCRRCERHHGVMIPVERPEQSRLFEEWMEVLLDEVMLLPVDIRREVEGDICVSLAGTLAAWMAAPPPVGRLADPGCDRAAERAAKNLARLSPRHVELLEASEATPNDDDETSASKTSYALAGKESAYHLEWLRAVTQRLVVEQRKAIGRLGQALLVDPIIAGPEAEAILLDRTPKHERTLTTMPSLPERKPKPGPIVYVATQSFVAEVDGQDLSFAEGVTRVHADHPVLKTAAGTLFEPDKPGAGPLREPKQVPRLIDRPDPLAVRLPDPPLLGQRVMARRQLFVNAGVVLAGSVWDSNHPIVRANPHEFEPALPESEPAQEGPAA